MAIAIAIGASGASALMPDIRIIVIDDTLFAGIENDGQRRQAVEDMLADIRMFEDEAPSRLGTIVISSDGPNLDKLYGLPQGNQTADSLEDHPLINGILNGASGPSVSGFAVYDLRDLVRAIAKKNSLHRDRGVQRQIDLHIFGNTWLTSSATSSGNMQNYDFPGACYAQNDGSTREWYDHITLAVEFRPPEGFEKPTPSAMFGMMTVLSGSSSPNSQVKMRGETAAGPTCAMGTLQDFIDPDANTNVALQCTAPVFHQPSDDLAIKCSLPIAPAIGVNLDRNPIHLVARNDRIQIGAYNLVADGGGFDLIISTGIGGPVFVPGQNQPFPATAWGIYNATLEISPRSGCLPVSTLTATLTSDQAEIQFSGAYAGCADARINLHEVTIR